MVWLIVAAAALALGAGLCASAEVALMRVSRSGAGELARSRKGNGNRAATRLQAVLAEPARYLAVLLLARVCAETAAIVLVAAALLHWLGTGWHVFLLIWVIMAAILYVLTGIPGGDRPLQIPGAELIRQLVLDNQVMLGSVNAARGHFQMGADDLAQAYLRWGAQIAGLITNRYSPDQFAGLKDQHQPDAIKEVIEWAQPGR